MFQSKQQAIGVSTLLGLWASSPAHACSPALCEPTVRLFGPNGIEVATNLVYFKLLVDDPGPLVLRTQAGMPIAASIKQLGDDRVFAPEQPLPDGTDAELVYTSRCKAIGPEPQQAQPLVFKFRAGIAGDYQPRPGSLELVEQGLRYPRQTQEASFIVARYYTPEVTGGAFHLMDHFATIDGLAIGLGTVDFGNPGIRIESLCSPPNDMVMRDTCGAITSVPPGDHVLEVWSHVVGQTGVSEHARLEINTRCNATCSKPPLPTPAADVGSAPPPLDAGALTPPSAAGSSAPEREEARAVVIAPPDDHEATAASVRSCSATHIAKSPAGPLMLAVVALAISVAGRRRLARSRKPARRS